MRSFPEKVNRPLILAIDTASPVCSVALHEEGKLLAEAAVYREMSHASQLHPLIQQVMEMAGAQRSDLAAVAASGGPGSYTGLRIGVSAAKGMCFALDIPLLAYDTLTALAAGVAPFVVEEALLIPMMDARRMEVYTQTLTPSLQVLEQSRPLVLDEQSFSAELSEQPVFFFGSGAGKFSGLINHSNARFLFHPVPLARNAGRLVQQAYEQQEFKDLAYFTPDYLKPFQTTQPKKRS